MDPNDDQRELREYFNVLARRKGLIAGVTAACLIAAVVVSLLQTPIYRATAEVLFESGAARLVVSPGSQRIGDPQRLLQNEVEFFESQRVSEVAGERLGYDASVSVVVSQPTGDIMFATAESDDPQRAADIANAHAQAYIDERKQQAVIDFQETIEVVDDNLADVRRTQFETSLRIGELNTDLADAGPNTDIERLTAERNALAASQSTLFDEIIRLSGDKRELELGFDLATDEVATVTDPAEPPGSPSSPQPLRDGTVGLIFGFVLAVGIAFVRDYLDDSIKTKDRLEIALGNRTPTLAEISEVKAWKDDAEATLISVVDPRSQAAEGYRSLRTALAFVHLESNPKVIEFTSAAAGEGKTTTVANLAVAIAQSGNQVLVIDADLRRSRVHEFFGISPEIGLATAIRDQTTEGAIQEVADVPGLSVLAAGGVPPDPAELLASGRVDELLADLRDRYDYILVDCPPVLPVADALSVSRATDAIVLVADAAHTSLRELEQAVRLIDQVDAPLIGTVLNRSVDNERYYYDPYKGGYPSRYVPTDTSTTMVEADARDAAGNGSHSPAADADEHDAPAPATTGGDGDTL